MMPFIEIETIMSMIVHKDIKKKKKKRNNKEYNKTRNSSNRFHQKKKRQVDRQLVDKEENNGLGLCGFHHSFYDELVVLAFSESDDSFSFSPYLRDVNSSGLVTGDVSLDWIGASFVSCGAGVSSRSFLVDPGCSCSCSLSCSS